MHLPSARRLLTIVLGLAVVLAAIATAGGLTVRYLEAQDRPDQARRLAGALELGAGSTVAEVGAGNGAMAVEMARLVGPSGRVLATELGERQMESIRRRAERAGISNLEVLQAGETSSNLPAGCCDAVYLQRVYHHLTDPAPVMASIAAALKPGGRLAIVDFEPRWGSRLTAPDGVPERGGHGVPREMLRREMADHGFRLVGAPEDFGDRQYLAVFTR